MAKKDIWKWIAVYLAEVILLFLFGYFTFIKPTALVFIPFLSMPLFVALCVVLFGVGAAVLVFVSGVKMTPAKAFLPLVLNALALLAGVSIGFGLLFSIYALQDASKTHRINQFAEDADVLISYSTTEHHGYADDYPLLAQNGHVCDTIMIDYDTHTIGIFMFQYTDFEFYEFILDENTPLPTTEGTQLEIPLTSPGATLTCYYPQAQLEHRTSSIALTMADGTAYVITDLKEDDTGYYMYLGLNTSIESIKIYKQ